MNINYECISQKKNYDSMYIPNIHVFINVIMIILSQQADSQIYTPSLSVKQVSVCVCDQ